MGKGNAKRKILILALILFVCCALMNNQIGNYRYLNYEIKFFNFEDASKKIVIGALGEFSKTLAAYIWIKSDFYWHEYKGYWKENKEVMPLVKLVTLLDPNQAQAYDFGGYHLAMDLGDVKKGVLYLQEGLKNNPDNAGLNYTYAMVCFVKIKDYPAAVKYAKRAFALSADNLQKINALRVIYNSYAALGDYKNAALYSGMFLKILPSSKVVQEKMKLYQSKIK